MTRYYEVIGAAPVVLDGRSVAPGVITTAELDAALEAFLLRLGALRIVDPATESELILPARHRPALGPASLAFSGGRRCGSDPEDGVVGRDRFELLDRRAEVDGEPGRADAAAEVVDELFAAGAADLADLAGSGR